MEVSNDKRKYTDWYKEISLGITTIRKSGRSLSITIPKKIAISNDLKKDDKVICILIQRKRKLLGRKNDDEVWVRMSKSEQIKFTEYLNQEKELDAVISHLD